MNLNRPCVILGCGFLGIPLAHQLLSRGHQLIVIDRNPSSLPTHKYLTWIQLDLSKSVDHLSDLIPDNSIVFHFISTTVPADSTVSFSQEYKFNISLSESIIQACIKSNVYKLVFSSSASVYGECPSKYPHCESSILRPISVHGLQKSTIEQILYYYHIHYGLPISILRISNPYGSFGKFSRRQGIIGILLYNHFNNELTSIYGNDCVRDYIFIDDVIRSIILLSCADSCPLIINISSSIGISTFSLIEHLERLLSVPLLVKYFPSRSTDINHSVLSNASLSKFIDTSSFLPIEVGLSRTLHSFNQLL